MKRLAAVVALLAFAVPAHAGAATLGLNMQDRIDSLDPALGFENTTWEPVTAASFMRAFTRSLDPALHGTAANYVHDIVGADAYAAGAASTIQGITQVGPFLSIHRRPLRQGTDGERGISRR